MVLDKAHFTNGSFPLIRIEIGHDEMTGIGLRQTAEGLQIIKGALPAVNSTDDKIRLLSPRTRPSEIRIYLDYGSIEVSFTIIICSKLLMYLYL